MCEFHDSNGNGLGGIWRTDKSSYFSIIDDRLCCEKGYFSVIGINV